jgi:molybdopterin converting factor small subunit
MSSVQLEILPWLSRYFATGHAGRVALELEVVDGMTVRDLLEEITAQDEAFRQVLFNPNTGRLAGHISLILNGRLVELSGGLEAKLGPGDTIQLLPGFSGG